MIENVADLPEKEFAALEKALVKHKTLSQALDWASRQPETNVAEVVTQDEYTHDVIIRYKRLFLVYDTT